MQKISDISDSFQTLRELKSEQYEALYQVTCLLNTPEMHESLIEQSLAQVINAQRRRPQTGHQCVA